MNISVERFSTFLFEKRWGILLFVLLLLSAILRFYRLDYQSFGVDEHLTFQSSSQPITQILTESKNKNFLGLFFLVIHLLLGFENRELWLRLPSVIFGSFSILIFYSVVSHWFGSKIGLISASIMTVSPFHIWYSQEAMPYAMLLFLTLLSIWFLQRLIKEETNLWLTLGFILFTAATFYCHIIAIAYICYLGVYVLKVVPYQKWKKWIPVFVCIFLLIIPGIYRILVIPPDTSADPGRSFNPLSIAYTAYAFGTGYSLGPNLFELHQTDRMNYIISDLYIIFPLMLFFFVIFVLGARKMWEKYNMIFWLIALFFIFPLAFAVLGSIITTHPFNARYAILTFLPFIIFLAVGIQSLRIKWIYSGMLVILLVISTVSLNNYFFNERYHRENNRAAGQFLSANVFSDDIIVISSAPYTSEVLKHYYTGKKHLDFLGYPVDSKFVKQSNLHSDFKNIIGNRERFWLFLSRTFHSDPQEHIRKYFDECFIRNIEFTSNGVELILYKRKS